MTAESLGHIFIFIGIISTWIFPLWLYFHWLRDDDIMLADLAGLLGCTLIYFKFIAHYFEFTVSVSV